MVVMILQIASERIDDNFILSATNQMNDERQSNLPGQIEAALTYLRFAEEVCSPPDYSGAYKPGRKLSKTEFEVKDSALICLLHYFNQAIPQLENLNLDASSTDKKSGEAR